MKKEIKITLLILIILISIFLAYRPHFDNAYPIIGDEYAHISLAKQLLDEGKSPFTHPFFYGEITYFNLESGFHFFLTLLFSIIPGDPILKREKHSFMSSFFWV